MAGLRQSHLFDVLSIDEAQHLAAAALMCPYGPGEVAVRQGEQGSSLFFVLHGEMSVEVSGSEVARLGQGRMFGEMSLLTGEPRKATVKALSETVLAELSKEAVAQLLEKNDRLMERLSESLARHETFNVRHQSQTIGSVEADEQRSPVDYLKRLKAFFGKG